jgi:thiamine biosynthesis lipoprotein
MSSCSAETRRARPLLGTFVQIDVEAGDRRSADRAADRAFAEVEAIQRLMSFQDPASELSLINRSRAGDIVRLDPRTRAVLAAALELEQASGGRFDVAAARSGPGAPSFAQAIELLPGDRVRIRRPAVLDLSGIAKGYAVDRAVHRLRRSGAVGGCVNAGGDLRVFGSRAWPIHLRLPGAPTRLTYAFGLRESAMATSGDCFEPEAGIADPRTGRRVALAGSVTVVAPACLLADALTKIVALDAEAPEVRNLLARCGAAAFTLDTEGRLHGAKVEPPGAGPGSTGRPRPAFAAQAHARHAAAPDEALAQGLAVRRPGPARCLGGHVAA